MARLTVAALGLSLALVLAGAGCGGGGGTASETTATTTTTTPAKTTTVRLYFLRNGQMWPVSRSATKQQRRPGEPPWVAVGRTGLDALNRLWAGPLAREQSEMGLSTSMPQITAYADLLIVGSNSAIYKPSAPLSRNALAQVVYTLTQFPTVKSVKYKGKRYTRADFEAETPPILAESPLAFQQVASPIRVTGTANTFEATFQYELRDASGKILSKHFETATSGTGTRGTFDFSVPYSIDHDQAGTLTLYENSAEDGSRIHVQKIPLRLKA